MNYLLAKIRDGKGSAKLILSDKEVYSYPQNIVEIPFSSEDTIECNEWFCINNFSAQDYFWKFLGEPVNGTKYIEITEEEYKKISCFVSIQGGGNIYYLQRVTPSAMIYRSKICFKQVITYEENTLDVQIKEEADAIYLKKEDKLLFKKLSVITSIFNGIDQLYREATKEEVEKFVACDFIDKTVKVDIDGIGKANRKRILLVKEAWDSYSEQQKSAVLNSFNEYCPELITVGGKIKFSNEEELQEVLYGLLQRFFTTADKQNKRIASSVRKFRH